MISVNAIWLFSLIAFVAVFFILVIITLLNSTVFKKDFSLLRQFPYEFFREKNHTLPFYRPLLHVLTGLAFSPIFVITPIYHEFGDLAFLCIFITCVFGLAAASNALLFYFDARYTKTHIVLVTVSMCLTLLANALAAILSFIIFKSYMDSNDSHNLSLVLGIASGLLAFFVLLMVVNPKLSNWTKLRVNEDENGEKTIDRGKIFVLAFCEWLTIAALVVGEVLFFLSLIK